MTHVELDRGERGVGPTLRGEGRRTVTAAERRVARRLADGKTPAEIATQLGVSIYTVRAHLRALYRKLGVNRQAALVRVMLTGGLTSCWMLWLAREMLSAA